MRFTLKQLKYFVTAGEFGSVTKAAEKLFVSQPSISSAVLHLEEATGLQLFVRHHAQGLSLTPVGKQFMVKAKQLLSDADDLGHYAKIIREEVSGSLSIVGFPTFTPMLLPSLMRRFVDTYPEVNIQCDEAHQQVIIQSLIDGRYEMALTYDLQIPSGIEFEAIMEFPPYIVLSASHPLYAYKELSIRDIAEYPVVLLDWPITRDYFYSLFLSQDLEPNIAYHVQSLEMVKGLVSKGFGYTIFNAPLDYELDMEKSVAMDGEQLKAISLTDKLRPLRVGVAKLNQYKLTPAAEAFIKMLKESRAE